MTLNSVENDDSGVRIAVRDRPTADARMLWPSVGEYGVYDEIMYWIMSNDVSRTSLYEDAIRALAPGKVVLDIGTGADMNWALAAARAGATRVYAIEELDSTFEEAKQRLAELPERDRVVLVNGASGGVDLPERVDLCVSEIIGTIGSSEGVNAALEDARARFSKPDGRMIPHRCVTRVAAVRLPAALHAEPGFDRSTVDYVRQVFSVVGRPFDVRVCVAGLSEADLISDAGIFEDLCFDHMIRCEYEHRSNLRIQSGGRVDGLLCWIELQAASQGGTLDSLREEVSWLPVFFPLWYPGIEVAVGDSIDLICRTKRSSSGRNPDYRLEASVVRGDGRSFEVAFDSMFESGGFRETPFYQRLFPVI